MTHHRLLAALLLAIVAAPAASQSRSALPANWHTVGSGDTASYRIGLDRATRHSGAASGHIKSTKSDFRGFTGLAQSVRPDNYVGKRIKFSAGFRRSAQSELGCGYEWMGTDWCTASTT